MPGCGRSLWLRYLLTGTLIAMTLSYELARRHYQIQRHLELDPGTRAYEHLTLWLQDLPAEALVQLLEHNTQIYQQLVPLCLLARRFYGLSQQRLTSPVLKTALEELYTQFSLPLIQELERLIHDEKLSRYPFVRSLFLQEMRFHQQFAPRLSAGNFDKDRFRQYLGGYVYLLRGGLGDPFLPEAWNETGWLRRWQLESTPARQLLPVQASLRNQIAKFKFSEKGKGLYTFLEQSPAQPELFLSEMESATQEFLVGIPVQLNDKFEGALRELVQAVMRVVMKKGYRVETISQKLLEAVHQASAPAHPYASGLVVYTLIQELILATQNLKYRLNDSLNGIARGLASLAETPGAEQRWHWSQHALLDGVMEIYESFTLADNALKAFVDHYQTARGEARHLAYEALAPRLAGMFGNVS